MFILLRKPVWLAALAALIVVPAAADAAPRGRVVVRPAARPPVAARSRVVVRPGWQVAKPAPIPAVRPIPPIGRDRRSWSPYPIRPIPPIGSDPRTWSPYPLYPWDRWGYDPFYPWVPYGARLPGNPYLGD